MSKPAPGLKPYRTINTLNTGPLTDAYRDGWERTFGNPAAPKPSKRAKAKARMAGRVRARVDELRAAADRARSGDNAAELEREADALEAAARAEGVWDG